MMSDFPESAASESDDLRLELAEDSDIRTAFTKSNVTTVIAKFNSRDNSSDPDQSQQSLPSHNPPVTDDTDDTFSFSFDKFIQVNPHLSWEAPSKDEPPKEVQVEVSEESDFSFENFVQTHGLSLAAIDIEDEEPVAAAMSRWNTPSLSQSDESSSSDSMMRVLLQPPPSLIVSKRPREHIVSTTLLPSSPSEDKSSSSDSMMRALLQPPPSLRALELSRLKIQSTTLLSSSSSEDGSSSPDSCGNRRRTESVSSSAIDPSATGLAAMNRVLRDGAMLTIELKEDARQMGLHRKRCVCDVSKHPSWWSQTRIQDVHNYSFLLDCQDLGLDSNLEVAANRSETIKVYKIPMSHNNPLKLKVEQVLKFVDVEVGFRDKTCYNLFHYVQPHDRKVLLVVSRQRVVGVLVAEEVLRAHRILRQTMSYMELEEDPTPVKVGINRLWVHISMRRKHLATVLCKLLGLVFYENENLEKEDYAFNNISNHMVMFAKLFLKTLRPPLYLRAW